MMRHELQQGSDSGNAKDEWIWADETQHKKAGLNIKLKLSVRGDLGKDGPIRPWKQTIQKEELDIGCFDEDKEKKSQMILMFIG